jgi:hypothetical protein
MADDIFEKIGYGRPPKKNQFKKGQSGNPGGRPKGSKSAGDAVIENMKKRVPARINGRAITTNVQDAVIKAQIKKALDGDTRAAKFLMDMNDQAEKRKYYMETAADYLDKLITKSLQKAVYDAKDSENELREAQLFAEASLKRHDAEFEDDE